MKSSFPILSFLALALTVTLAAAKSPDVSMEKDASAPPSNAAVAPSAAPSHCPSDMVEVDGNYCTDLEMHCNYNTEINGSVSTKPVSLLWACGEFTPSTCKGEMVHMHFCIDRYEWPNKEGQVPQDWMTWYDAKRAVESVGKRLCTHKEWTLAAEGPEMHPLPYGDGYHRTEGICNFDRDMGHLDPSKAKTPHDEMSERLRAVLVPSGSMPNCASDFGVHDMAGNVDEWVVNEASNLMVCPPDVIKAGKCMQESFHSGLMGGHVWHVRNASRPMTTAHYPGFGWYETGTRACKDIDP